MLLLAVKIVNSSSYSFVAYCLAYTAADDDSRICVVETSSFEICSDFIFPPYVIYIVKQSIFGVDFGLTLTAK